MNLVDIPSFPSGHATQGCAGPVVFAVLVPERYSEMIARAAEYENEWILVIAYAMDVLGGQTLALYDLANLFANDPAYMGKDVWGSKSISDFQLAVRQAREVLVPILEPACGGEMTQCTQEVFGRFSHSAENEPFYNETQTYNLPVVHPKSTKQEVVYKIDPEAGYLLTQGVPSLTLK